MKKVLILGAGDLGRQLYHFITSYTNDEVVGWIDDTKVVDELILEKPVYSNTANITEIDKSLYHCVALGIGYKHLSNKKRITNHLITSGIKLYSFIHPTAYIDCSAQIKDGVIIYPGTIVDQKVTIESGTLINNGVVVSHNTTIGACCFLAPAVTLCGNIEVGDTCFIGASTTVIENIKITNDVQTGANSIVTKDINKSGLYVGGPKLMRI